MPVSHRSSIGRQVSEYLRVAHPIGLTISEVYDRLVADQNYPGTKQLIMDLLTGNPNAYVKGASGHWLDATLAAADGGRSSEGEEEAARADAPDRELYHLRIVRPTRRAFHQLLCSLRPGNSDRRHIRAASHHRDRRAEICRWRTGRHVPAVHLPRAGYRHDHRKPDAHLQRHGRGTPTSSRLCCRSSRHSLGICPWWHTTDGCSICRC